MKVAVIHARVNLALLNVLVAGCQFLVSSDVVDDSKSWLRKSGAFRAQGGARMTHPLALPTQSETAAMKSGDHVV